MDHHLVQKSYKFRIYPDEIQRSLIDQTFGCCRVVWNRMVEEFNAEVKLEDRSTIKQLREEFEWMKRVSHTALAYKKRDFEDTLKQFFNKNRKTKIGKPGFKKKGACRDSYKMDKIRFKTDQANKKIKLEKIGGWISYRDSRAIPAEAEYRNITVSKDKSGKYYASILVIEKVYHKPKTGKEVGIDLGLKSFICTSDGKTVKALKSFRENQAKLAKAQKHLDRKRRTNKRLGIKGSKRYQKQRIKVARIHEEIANQREWFLHNLSAELVRDNDIICIEDLAVSNMVKNKRLAKSIADAGWSKLTSMLEYKCQWYGKTLIRVDRFFASSKTCGNCSSKFEGLELSMREWECPDCTTVLDRDLNAAKNILKEGLRLAA